MRGTHIVAIATTLMIAPTLAHDHATGVVKERMDMMEAMDKSLNAIAGKLKSKRNLPAIKKDAEALQSHAPHLVHLFPPGSTQPPTEAKPAIWQNFADFEAKAKAFETESGKLATMDMRDAAVIASQVRVVTETCTICHDLYRQKRATR